MAAWCEEVVVLDMAGGQDSEPAIKSEVAGSSSEPARGVWPGSSLDATDDIPRLRDKEGLARG
jgi:hypothetical protein